MVSIPSQTGTEVLPPTRDAGQLTRSARLWWTAILVLLGAASLVSMFVGFKHGMAEGWDSQIGGARLIRQHVDIWDEAVRLGPHRARYIGPPNYLHELYVVLLPLSSLSVRSARAVWCVLIVLFSIAAMLVLQRCFSLSRRYTLLVLFLLWMSAPFRVTLEVGQASTFELLFLALAFAPLAPAVRGLSLGMSFSKYSFAPLPVAVTLLRRKLKVLLWSALLPICGLLIVRAMVPSPLTQLLLGPFRVAQLPTSVSPGVADAMTFGRQVLEHWFDAGKAQHLSYLIGIAGCLLFAIVITRFRLPQSSDLMLVFAGSLLFFTHLSYDYIFLVPVLCFALKSRRLRTLVVLSAGVFVFWFVKPVLLAADASLGQMQVAINFFLLLALLAFATYAAVTEAITPRSNNSESFDAHPVSGSV